MNSNQDKLSEFEIQYFIQTRKEIDTEKQERNKILNYMLISAGAIAVICSQRGIEFFNSITGFAILVSLLIIIFGLVNIRRIKLRQIANRWQTLENMLNKSEFLKELNWEPLERIVMKGVRATRYLAEDKWGYLPLCFVIYVLIIRFGYIWLCSRKWFWGIASLVVIIIHFVITWELLSKPIELEERE